MVKVYGTSDDLLEIEGSRYHEQEIDCFERDVVLYFEDGTVVRCGYPKAGKAIWFIRTEHIGGARYKIRGCDDENAEIYSDILEIDSDVVFHHVIERNERTPDFFRAGQLVVYCNGRVCEIGRIKRLTEDGAFVYYSSSETSAMTSYDTLYPIANAGVIMETLLCGGH